MSGEIVWADLSMFDPVQDFYVKIFDWDFVSPIRDMAFYDDVAIAGFSFMPEKFRALNLPSFWMSYIAVPSVVDCVATAKTLGAKVELHDTEKDMALIRDPLGAGFSVCGPNLGPSPMAPGHGRRRGHALHVSDLLVVAPFYTALFDWTFEDGAFRNDKGWFVAKAFEESDAQRGGYEYWSVAFGVRDVAMATRIIEANGGAIAGPCNSGAGALSATDPNGAAFVIQPEGADWNAD